MSAPIDLTVCTTDELRRAALLMLVRSLFPLIDHKESVRVTRWLLTGRWELVK